MTTIFQPDLFQVPEAGSTPGQRLKVLVFVAPNPVMPIGGASGTIHIRRRVLFHPGPTETVPQRPLLDWEEWPRAWAQALIMDPVRVSRLLAYYTENMEACFSPSSYEQLRYEDLGLYCPDTWNFW